MDVPVIYLLTTLISLITFLYFYSSRKHSYWQKKGIPCMKNIRPIFGNTPIFSVVKTVSNLCTKIYYAHANDSMVGFYDYNAPCLLIRDPELVKNVLITNFVNFAENNVMISENEEPLLSKNPFFNTGSAWKNTRTMLTSAFTVNKLKNYAGMIEAVVQKLTNYVDEKIKKNDNGEFYEVESKKLFSRVTAEVAATVGFGIEGNCFDDSKEKESFEACGQLFFNATWANKIKMMIIFQFPWLLAILKISMVPESFELFFRQLVRRSIENRKKDEFQNLHFVDMITEQMQKEGDLNTQDKDISAHMFSFFFDTYETTSIILSFVFYHLAINKEIQAKARQEAREVIKKHGQLNYDAASDLVYAEQIVYETLRIFPVFPAQIKKCTQKIELQASDGLKCVVEPETKIFIPIEGLHKDPKIWDDPETFRPERFSKENLTTRNKMVHLPFGEGPRMCPGRKMALMTNKMTIAAMLMKYEIELSKKTKMPLEMDPFMFLLYVKGGLWLKIKKLKQ